MKKEEILEILLKKEKFRLNYHLMPAKGLLNDPNGLVEKDGIYHVFYQWNDKECEHGAKKWGLYTSKNLINWEIEDVALTPEEWYETHGCYSGSGIVIDDKINLVYTGNVKNEKGDRETYQCLAVEKNDGSFEKLGTIIDMIPAGFTEHFRDPKVWGKDGYYFMVLGAQNTELKGEVLLYKSENFRDWELVDSIYNKQDLGYMIECPDLFELNGEKILLSSPQGIEAKGDLFNNLYQSGYMIGEVDYMTGENKWNEFMEIDRGFDFYAPQTFSDSKGRRIMYAWMGMEENGHLSVEEGNWVHALTMPRELVLKNGRIFQKPLDEFKTLRVNEKFHKNLEVEENIMIEGIEGKSYELIVELHSLDSEEFGIKLRKNSEEELLVKFKNDKLIINRDKTLGLKGQRACKTEENIHKLHIFMDESSMELFYNDGKEVFTTRFYVNEDAKDIEFFSKKGKCLIKNLEFYELKGFSYSV